jgi:2-amino-4-hydroxy-6-hydroxymethyldihydropteridine diphosphokinase
VARGPLAEAYLGLGSNLGDKAAMLDAAVTALSASPGITVTARSRNYRTPPWGDTDQDWFLNAAVGIETALPPHALLEACLSAETRLGRVRERRWGPRVIDIDVLHYAGATVSDERLVLPHRFLRERAFVLVPLAEIAPDLVIGGESVVEALGKLDRSGIEPVDGPASTGRPTPTA